MRVVGMDSGPEWLEPESEEDRIFIENSVAFKLSLDEMIKGAAARGLLDTSSLS